MTQPIDIVIMAAGKGTRMKSATPKVLQKLAHQGLVQHVLDTAAQLQARKVVVITGHGAEQVEAALATAGDAQPQREFVRQMPQLGTGHAVQQAVPVLDDDGIVVILSGDVPLTQADTIQALVQQSGGDKLALLTLRMDNPFGYGRVMRDAYDNVERIVEQKDGTPDELAVKEIYSGIMAAPARLLKQWLGRIDNDNAQNEYYLTDVVKLAAADGVPVLAHVISDAVQVAGVNSPLQLAELEREYQKRQAERLMADGVRLRDPSRFDLRGSLSCGQDVEIDVNCVFEGTVKLGSNVRIGANCVLANCEIGDGAVIHPFTHVDGEKLGVRVGAGALIGPFARLRPGADLGEEVHIGNFVEVKNSTMAKGAKANHLAYLGDATVGERVNYGAGTITANYDGANKHRTVIEADVHIGSNSVLVAPVTIGAGGTVGAGSTIGRDTPPNALSVVRGKLVQKENYQRPVKIKK
ncbi:bifunctional UDP-N-acetylglucosamine diphosphorylase/glucosamine-1-phosphate N-acetyltransferase GlmU [Brachymonas denitrificans]|uniref:Bifunctional protein GlmU n=1 Tax=Brachymonas denitrificans DSM 15123 TaxID=1121117 RepID=A0A1H8E8U8_9BURK|nr:bifunctional UDP-N-acetylglucosamine diphosphorylase/glucosamine-1-phosphate N-acetyltransferase GlmU [Brachymonas denitrificans]SEN15925.1 UDP-N-acetylglucosamine pyrophosphorylase /glucosamine-1-phosphate N-acetyltransferase [Brachymonas denitrificans DSM 15123]